MLAGLESESMGEHSDARGLQARGRVEATTRITTAAGPGGGWQME